MTGDEAHAMAPDTRPRALLIVPSLHGNGGAERRVRILRRSLTRLAVETAVFHMEDPGASTDDPTLHVLGWTGALSYPRVVMRLRELIAHRRYDVVMAFGTYPNFVTWFATRALAGRPRVILSEITRPHLTSRYEHPWTRRVMTRWLRKLTYGRGDGFAANSIDGLEESIAHFGVKRERARRVAGVIDSQELRKLAGEAPAAPIDGRTFTVCTSARFDAMKRLDTLLHALHKLPSDLEWRAILVGDGAERAKLEALASTLGIASRVHFAGWIANPFPVIGASSVYVHCSELEGLSNAVLEAMFLGVPVVSSFCSSDTREMERMGAALGYEPGDDETLAAHLETLMRETATAEALRARALEYCQRHERSTSIADYEALLLNAAGACLVPAAG